MTRRGERPDLDAERRQRVQAERERLRQAFPAEFDDGVARARAGNPLYPLNFASWPLDKRNSWFAGFNQGYHTRLRSTPERADG
jgi:hypothetical protein